MNVKYVLEIELSKRVFNNEKLMKKLDIDENKLIAKIDKSFEANNVIPCELTFYDDNTYDYKIGIKYLNDLIRPYKYFKIDNKIVLKQLTIDNLDRFYELIDKNRNYLLKTHKEISRYANKEEISKFLTGITNSVGKRFTKPFWYIEIDKKMVGVVGIKQYGDLMQLVSYVAEEYVGQGILHKVLPQIIAFAFEYLDVKELYYYAYETDAATIGLYKKLGFKYMEIEKIKQPHISDEPQSFHKTKITSKEFVKVEVK